MNNDDLQLTEEEIKKGWHFCVHFDGLLIGPGMGDFTYCLNEGYEGCPPQTFQ